MKMKRYSALFSLCMLLAMSFTATASAYNPFGAACANGGSDSAVCTSGTSSNPVSTLLINVTHIVAIIAGVAAVVIIIVSGIRFITSQGESDKAASARNTLINTAIGLVVIVLAQAIIAYVITKFVNH
jgi:hypothetical protein